MSTNISGIFSRVKQIILKPKDFWRSQREEPGGQMEILFAHILPLLLLACLAVFIGEFFSNVQFYAGSAVYKSLRKLVFFVLFYFISVFFTNQLMQTFGGTKDIRLARKLMGYSITPFLLIALVTGLVPYLQDLNIMGLYCFYLFWLGGKELVDMPAKKLDSYLMLTITVNFFVYVFLGIALSAITSIFVSSL